MAPQGGGAKTFGLTLLKLYFKTTGEGFSAQKWRAYPAKVCAASGPPILRTHDPTRQARTDHPPLAMVRGESEYNRH
jgi:hypothetical protein